MEQWQKIYRPKQKVLLLYSQSRALGRSTDLVHLGRCALTLLYSTLVTVILVLYLWLLLKEKHIFDGMQQRLISRDYEYLVVSSPQAILHIMKHDKI
jgi:hypothetical protein